MQMKYKEIKDNEEVQALIAKGNENLGVLGFTDHSEIHASLVAERAAEILGSLGYKKKQIELVKVAAYMHDIGNAINRSRHAEYGAILANDLLKQKNIDIQERLTIVSAIAHHDESTGGATDVISAALIIADKTDVRRNRVRQKPKANFDVHDRVNHAANDFT
jgi:metal-dependent HD superfamily phosphatase/phosphodiesterase